MDVLNANCVFTRLNLPINVFLKTTTSDLDSKEIITLNKYRWIQPLSELAELHFRGSDRNFFIICVTLL